MSTATAPATVQELVRNSPPATKAAVLVELLKEFVPANGDGPAAVPDGFGEVAGYFLRPPPPGPYPPRR